jgi:4-carboxymuconolactone decarboxylase
MQDFLKLYKLVIFNFSKNIKRYKPHLIVFIILSQSMNVMAENKNEHIVRLSKLEIAPEKLEQYKAALKEEIEASVRIEPGVLTLYAVFEKCSPNKLTILEIYENRQAYESHVKTPHFLKYKLGTLEMVTNLELVDGDPLIPNLKIK